MRFRLLLSLILLTSSLGCGILFPPIVPPGPTPDPPGPIIPVPAGAKVVLILHESQQQTPEFSRLKTNLQTKSDVASYLASKGHTMFVLDIDSTDPDGKPLETIARLKPKIGMKALPVLIVGPKSSAGKIGEPTYVESLPNAAVAADVLAVVKKQGG